MYRPYGLQDRDTLLETLIMDDVMTFFPEFNLLVVSSSYDPSEGLYNRTTAIFNARTSEIASGEFFKGCDFVSDMVFEGGQNKAFAIFDTFERDADGGYSYDPRLLMLANLFSWSPTIDVDSIPDMVDAAANYQEYQLSDREFRDYVRRDVLAKSKSSRPWIMTPMRGMTACRPPSTSSRPNSPTGSCSTASRTSSTFPTAVRLSTQSVSVEPFPAIRENNRNLSEYDSVILKPFRPVGFEGDIEDVDLPAAIEENREIVELIVSMEAAPYMGPNKLPVSEQSLDSLCEDKTDEAQSMRYGMEGIGLPMLDAAEHLANY